MAKFLYQKHPEGVTSIIDKGCHQAQVIYNPRVIGARDVSHLIMSPTDTLASLSNHAVSASTNTFLWSL